MKENRYNYSALPMEVKCRMLIFFLRLNKKSTLFVNKGKPRPSLTWWRDYSLIDDSFEYNDKDGTISIKK